MTYFTLANERGSGCDNGLGTGHTHRPEEKNGKLANEPLENAIVIQQLHERDEEDDGGDDAGQEPAQLVHAGVGQELDTVAGETEKLAGEKGDEVEDIEADFCAEHEERDDILDKLMKSVSIESDRLRVSRLLTIPMIIVCPSKSGQH